MKKLKKLLAFCMFSCMMFAVSACSAVDSAFSQVNGILHNMLNKHEYATEWSKDETTHWLACTSEGCQSVSQKADHTYGEGEVIEEATEEKDGVMSYECTVCGYEKTEKIAKPAPPAHVHISTPGYRESVRHSAGLVRPLPWYKKRGEHYARPVA